MPHVQAGPDGSSIAIWRDARRTADEIRRYSPHDADAWLELARTLETAMDVLLPYMLTHPTRPNLRNLLSAASGAVRHPRQLAPLGRFLAASLAEVIDERFEHPLTRGVLASVAPFSWVTQDSTGWALIYLGLIQRISPARFEGGTGALPAALHRCLLAHGGRVRTSALVDELVVRSGQVTGVRLANGEEIDARAVIASCSPKTTLTRLLPDGVLPEHLAKRARHIPTSTVEGGHLKINVALRGRLRVPRHEKVRGDGLDLREAAAHLVDARGLHRRLGGGGRPEVAGADPGHVHGAHGDRPDPGPRGPGHLLAVVGHRAGASPRDLGDVARPHRQPGSGRLWDLLRGARQPRDRTHRALDTGPRGSLPRDRRERLPRRTRCSSASVRSGPRPASAATRRRSPASS